MMENRYVFLDRDGVINKDGFGWTEHGYITRPQDFYFLPKVLETLRSFKEAGYKVIIISNQQGVAKGYFSDKDLSDVTGFMKNMIKSEGGEISGVYYCTHAKEEGCACRKPSTGLFAQAEKDLGIQIKRGNYYYIGDTQRDVKAGRSYGLKTILVLTGKTLSGDEKSWENRPDHVCEDLSSAFKVVVGEEEK